MFSSIISGSVTASVFLACTAVSIVLGLGAAWVFMYKSQYSKSFVVTLALLPAIVQMVIMMVNGNIGTGVAVAGAFSLVRFRSAQGTAREIGSLFLAMALGLATGMGYLAIAMIFFFIMAAFMLLLGISGFGTEKNTVKELRITISENLDYQGIFDDLFSKYLSFFELYRVKTTNMGSLYELRYRVTLKDEKQSKQLLDDLRCRNGNLNIAYGRFDSNMNL